jgi:hypothetical protein
MDKQFVSPQEIAAILWRAGFSCESVTTEAKTNPAPAEPRFSDSSGMERYAAFIDPAGRFKAPRIPSAALLTEPLP